MVRRVIIAHGMKLAAAKTHSSAGTSTSPFAAFMDFSLNSDSLEVPSGSSATAGTNQFLLPLPNADVNKSQTSIPLPEEETVVEWDWDNLPPVIASADISLASTSYSLSAPFSRAYSLVGDNSFIETSSGAAARELKRRFDRYLGVGKNVRSPYAITAFINQHGKDMYRVG